jgi:hypothetical protein
VSKKSRQKTERRHKREQKQKRHDQQRQRTRLEKQTQLTLAQPSSTSFNKSAWSTLQPPTNTVSTDKPTPVLAPSQGFDLQKWKPNDKDHSE